MIEDARADHRRYSLADDDAQAMFNRQLATYRKIVGANCMYHREVYGVLRNSLLEEMATPFVFLDIACGDASASAAALQASKIQRYCGIDLSARSLSIARESLKVLSCPIELHCCDFAKAMERWTEAADVVWIGMSLHHLQRDGKLRLMKNVRKALNPCGIFMIWEPTLLTGESRQEWLDRFSACRPLFSAVTDEEFAEMDEHIRLADFPESAETWRSMGHEAGFAYAEEVFMMPNRMGRVFKYGS